MDEATLSALPQAVQPATMKHKLLPYQLQGLAWMREKEHPQLPPPESKKIVQLWQRTNLGNFTNLVSNHITRSEPELLSGGILSDEMGLGKTIQTISLIMDDGFGSGPTLIIAPTGVLSNWEQQFAEHVKESHLPRVLRYHGSSKFHGLTKTELLQYHVIITSYGMLASQFKSQNFSALFSVNWRRVVLDEGHIIRNPDTWTSRAACHLKAKSRWILSGTPFVNSTIDFYSALLFLKISGGIEERSVFENRIARPLNGMIKGSSHIIRFRGEAQDLFQSLVRDLCLRRKKDMAFIDLKMPEKTEYVHEIRFTELEQLRYQAMLVEARKTLEMFLSQYDPHNRERRRITEPEVRFANVLETLLRLRQMCDHWSLTGSRVSAILEKLGKTPLVELTPGNVQILLDALSEAILVSEDCPICYDPINTHHPVITACKHRFGRTCIINAIKSQNQCPMCRQHLTENDLLEQRAASAEEQVATVTDSDRRSSKTDQLELLLEKHLQDPKSKVVVFSQWTSFLDIIQGVISDKQIGFVRLEGKMNTRRRDEAIKKLNTDPETRVMLASLHAAGVGVNLTAADTVILTDCWWAPAIEDQAIDRVHRIGQERPVTVHKLLMEGSVEYRVLDIQAQKRTLVALAFQDENYIRKQQGAVEHIRRLLFDDDDISL